MGFTIGGAVVTSRSGTFLTLHGQKDLKDNSTAYFLSISDIDACNQNPIGLGDLILVLVGQIGCNSSKFALAQTETMWVSMTCDYSSRIQQLCNRINLNQIDLTVATTHRRSHSDLDR